jgi:hypothetical protein
MFFITIKAETETKSKSKAKADEVRLEPDNVITNNLFP